MCTVVPRRRRRSSRRGYRTEEKKETSAFNKCHLSDHPFLTSDCGSMLIGVDSETSFLTSSITCKITYFILRFRCSTRYQTLPSFIMVLAAAVTISSRVSGMLLRCYDVLLGRRLSFP
ncbi:hypothetical protein BT96DRAFT_313770 [Gymnopus androsaceus JB14]|uniref:Uncharacterized protein n=1 Tax=Gymnopus androsaceus JB14 TaxID=1447944 RepID=A0A6A4I1M8_9AGAR|nr:hypothetical protein BT96DRAFT_313770 [Gymnopus androsaceus JB14]